jgi:hypothetical protein
MHGALNFGTADLDRLDHQIRDANLSSDNHKVWRALLELGRELAAAREAAEAAGLVFGASPMRLSIGNLVEAFDRSSTKGTRAIVGNVAPRR